MALNVNVFRLIFRFYISYLSPKSDNMCYNIYMDYSQLFKQLGLSDKEADLYNLLLTKGTLSATSIIRLSGLKRATAYKILYELVKKGLVSQSDIKKKIHFTPLPPDNLQRLSDGQIRSFEKARTDLQALLPAMTSAYVQSVEKPIVNVFEGVEGLKQIYQDTMNEGKEILAVLQTSSVDETLFQWLESDYIKARTAAKVRATVIVSSGEWSDEYIKRRSADLTTIRRVNETLHPFAHEIDIYGDKVAFINYKKGDALIGIVIQHPGIAQTMRAMFDLAWLGAKK